MYVFKKPFINISVIDVSVVELFILQVKVNALIKRASIKVQTTQNTQNAYADFDEAIKLDPENCDIFHHRGQVRMTTSSTQDSKT